MISFSEENTELWKKLFANEATKKHEYNSTGKILFYTTILMKEITSLIVTDKILSSSGISSSPIPIFKVSNTRRILFVRH